MDTNRKRKQEDWSLEHRVVNRKMMFGFLLEALLEEMPKLEDLSFTQFSTCVTMGKGKKVKCTVTIED